MTLKWNEMSERTRRLEQKYERKPTTEATEDPWQPGEETIVTSSSYRLPLQRGDTCCIASGLIWVFVIWTPMIPPTEFRWFTSPNGVDWTVHGYGSNIYPLLYLRDGMVDMTWAIFPGNEVRYRRGTLESDGSITWWAPEQFVANDTYVWYIGVSPDGYPAISYGMLTYRVTVSSTNDGTWITAPGNPVDMVYGRLMGYDGNKILIFSVDWERIWDGSSWGLKTSHTNFVATDIITTSNKIVAIVGTPSGGQKVLFAEKEPPFGSFTPTVLKDTSGDPNLHVGGMFRIAKTLGSDLYVTYSQWNPLLGNCPTQMYYRKRSGGIWEPPQLWVNELHYGSGITHQNDLFLEVAYEKLSGCINFHSIKSKILIL